MRFVIVTGMSGAGKSTALKMLEDAEYFCVDNLPIPLVEKFAQLTADGTSGEIQKVAVGIDIRSGQALPDLQNVLEWMSINGICYEILFLDASDDVLVKRYKETRRTHPLAGLGRVDEGIRKERKALEFLKKDADYILDTSQLLTRELKAELDKIFVQDQKFKNLMITVLSFGFKYGIPADADLVFDVRFLPNPYYIEELKKLDKNTYQIIDIRDENEVAHGAIPGAVATPADSIEGNENIDFSKKLVICCSRGRFSVEVAEGLEEKGMDAVSLEGGYIAWLLDAMKQEEEVDICKDVELSIRKKFRKSIWCKFTKAINQYELVKPGDRIAVCISGGKDSMLMAKLFQELKIHNKFDFEVKFLVMDPGYSPANRKVIEENARKLNIPITIFESDIFDSVYNIEKSPCYLCARMRRGHLYHFAQELGCNKIALGHHYDDVIETILMGMLYGAQIQTMMPKLHSTNFEGMELIRPLYLVREDDIKAWRDYNGLHFIQCACKFTDTCTTCNNEENRSKRVEIKELIKKLKEVNQYVEGNIFKSVENVNLETVVAYKKDGVKHHFLDDYDTKK